MTAPQFELLTLYPNNKTVGVGTLDVDKGGAASFSVDNRIVVTMAGTQLVDAAAHGILLRGYESAGCDREGLPNYTMQEWFLRYINK